jgi:hypothetical protein
MPKQKQTQKQEQKISIRIGDLKPKRKRRRARRKPKPEEPITPTRSLPPVVYQTLPQVSYYGQPNKTGSIVATPERVSSMVEPLKAKTTILEDIGMVGTEGPVEILEKPTKRETLKELITPIDIPTQIIDPVEQGKPFDIPLVVIDPAKSPILPSGGSFDIPQTIIDPPQEPSPAILRSEKATSITEIKPNIQFSEISNIPSTEISDIPIPSKKQRQPRRPKAEIQRSIELGLEKPRSASRTRYGSVPSFFTKESFGLPAEDITIAQESITPKPKPKSGLKIRSRSPRPGEKATQQTLNQLFGVKPTSV